MNCEEIRELMSGHIDGMLAPEETQLLDEHLSTCEPCRDELAELERAVALVKGLDSVEPPADLLDKVHERIDKDASTAWNRIIYMPVFKIAAAAAVIVMMAVIGLRERPVDERPGGIRVAATDETLEETKAENMRVAEALPAASEIRPEDNAKAKIPAVRMADASTMSIRGGGKDDSLLEDKKLSNEVGMAPEPQKVHAQSPSAVYVAAVNPNVVLDAIREMAEPDMEAEEDIGKKEMADTDKAVFRQSKRDAEASAGAGRSVARRGNEAITVTVSIPSGDIPKLMARLWSLGSVTVLQDGNERPAHDPDYVVAFSSQDKENAALVVIHITILPKK